MAQNEPLFNAVAQAAQMVTCIVSQYESNILTYGGFQKGITCLGSVHFQI